MIQVGDLVKMWLGAGTPGTVIEVLSSHPRADDPGLRDIRGRLLLPHARVFWSDLGVFELVKVSELVRLECE